MKKMDKEMQEWVDDLLRKEKRKEARINAIAKNVKQEAIIDHIRKKITRVKKDEFIAYRKEIQKIAKVDKSFNGYLAIMPYDTEGLKQYIRIKICTWIVIAARAGINAKEIGRIIDVTADTIGIPTHAEPLPKQPKRVDRYISPANLLIYDLVHKPMINAGAFDLPVMPKDEITTLVVVTYEGNTALSPFNLTRFERRVMDAVCSLYRYAITILHHKYLVFTPESVYMAMPGGGAKLNKDMRQKIVDAIEKLSSIRVDLDATSELRQAGKIENTATFTRKQNILYTKGGEYRQSNGRIITAWQLLDVPVIYEYAEKMGQLANVSAKYANIEGLTQEGEPDGVPLKMSDSRRGIVEVMLRRAVIIQRAQREAVKKAAWKSNLKAEHTKTWRDIMTAPRQAGGLQTSDIMTYDKIFEAAGAESTDKHTVKDNKDFCRHVWKYWQKVGFIHGFQEVKAGRTATGLQMLFKGPIEIEK